jgi:predicted glycosyltransferase
VELVSLVKKLTKALQQKGFSVFILTRDKNKNIPLMNHSQNV